MAKRIYVGNLPYNATEEDLRGLFEQHGPVVAVDLITDRYTGRARGFGFVEMDDAAASRAVEALDGAEMDGRQLRINEARPRGERRDSEQAW